MLSLLKIEYEQLFSQCVIDENRIVQINAIVDSIEDNQVRYQHVSENTGVPWYFIAIVHYMECNSKFNMYLYNDDFSVVHNEATSKTRSSRKRLPLRWECEAEDALKLKGLDKYSDWSVSGVLFQFEKYNGFGYRNVGLNSPYLWNFCNHYFPMLTAASNTSIKDIKRCGAAVLLYRMFERGLVTFDTIDIFLKLKMLSVEVVYSPFCYNERIKEMQQLLNYLGEKVPIDGFGGRETSDAYCRLFGSYLKYDPHSN